MPDYSEQVHFVCPKPKDVPDLMDGWMRFVERVQKTDTDSVVAAAALSFGFVFIHPFEDGNGRLHRFLIHHELARSGFAPQNLIFPVSAGILMERVDYDRILGSFSKPTLEFIEYDLSERGEMTVENEAAHLCRYWDATRFAEFLYACVSETIRRDLRDELGFLNVFDGAMKAVAEIVDMPDRRASLLVRMILQNRGELSKKKRASEFPELSDHVPDEDIRRRFGRANVNFWNVYKKSADKWHLVFNAGDSFEQIAAGDDNGVIILDEARARTMAENGGKLNGTVSDETLRGMIEFQRIGNRAVHKAQEENRRLGIPNWYSINSRIVSDQEVSNDVSPENSAECDDAEPKS